MNTPDNGNGNGDINSPIQSLIRFERERGYVSLQDTNSILLETRRNTQEIKNVLNVRENLEIETLYADEIEQYQSKIRDDLWEMTQSASDPAIEDAVRIYLHQMAQVSLLRKDHEAVRSKRIERQERRA
jgi:hypothetical protein